MWGETKRTVYSSGVSLPRRDELDLEAREQLDQRQGGGVWDPLINLHNISQCNDSTAVDLTQW